MKLDELIVKLGELYLAHGNVLVGVGAVYDPGRTYELLTVDITHGEHTPQWAKRASVVRLICKII